MTTAREEALDRAAALSYCGYVVCSERSADASSDVWEPLIRTTIDRLSHHLDAHRDPCDDRGVQWPCDVADALNYLKEKLDG